METKLFQAQNREGFLVNINVDLISSIDQKWVDIGDSIKTFLEWLEFEHNQIYLDIEPYDVEINEFEEGFQIVFLGENGIFELDEIDVELID